MDYGKISAANNTLWSTCQITPARLHEALNVSTHIFLNSGPYRAVQTDTGVPWILIGMLHYRECSFRFDLSLAQGDPWNRLSTHIPRGRGPFKSWHDAAVDALAKCSPYAARWKDWTPGGLLTIGEAYNGFGYEEYHDENSPYNWGATNHEERGKYTADGKYSAKAWDMQLGLAAILKAMEQQNQQEVSACLALTPNTALT